ncbi:MAG: hypothetical protein LBK06_05010, partial [Planctomycetaceae bacterium]|nr:hypothetical protein [Planctomycetaceae bacterium]
MGKFLKFVSFRKRYILLSFVILVILLFIIYHVNTRIFYDVEPIEKVVTNDLVGTWRFIPPISKKLFAKPSIIILKRDGSYEIHNPPIWVRKKCKPPTKIFMSESCGEIITGNWTLGKRKPSAGFNGIDQFGLHIQGKRQPYQLQYCRVAPDITPLR